MLNAIVKGPAVNNFEELFSNLGINRVRLKRIFIDNVTLMFLYNLMQKIASAYVEPEEKVQALLNLLECVGSYGVEVQVPEIDIEEDNVEGIIAMVMEALETSLRSEVVPVTSPVAVYIATGVAKIPTVTTLTTTTSTTTTGTTTEFTLPVPSPVDTREHAYPAEPERATTAE